jgi:hypothetical protein
MPTPGDPSDLWYYNSGGRGKGAGRGNSAGRCPGLEGRNEIAEVNGGWGVIAKKPPQTQATQHNHQNSPS